MVNEPVMMPLEDTLVEVERQPEVVATALENNHASVVELAQLIRDKGITKLYLVGSGDSMYLGQCVEEAFRIYAHRPLNITQAFEYAIYGNHYVDEQTLLIVISSSGRISTTRDALSRALNTKAFVVGITDQAKIENPFYSDPHYKLVPGAAKEGWPTQTTTATIILLIDLAIQIGKQESLFSKRKSEELFRRLIAIPNLMEEASRRSLAPMRKVGRELVDAKIMYFVGSGPGYGVANIGGALMAEGPQRVGVPLYVEEFHHSLRIHTVDSGVPVILIAPNDLAYRRYLDTARAVKKSGGYLTALVNEDEDQIAGVADAVIRIPSVPVGMSPLVTLPPLHQFSIELTKNRLSKGYQRPSRFQ